MSIADQCMNEFCCVHCKALLGAIGVGEKSATVIGATFQVKKIVLLASVLRFLVEERGLLSN